MRESPLNHVIEEALNLSQCCLSQPWDKTETVFRAQLMQWQQLLQESAENWEENHPDKVREILTSLDACIQLFVRALQEKNCILLSNTLVNQWVSTLLQI